MSVLWGVGERERDEERQRCQGSDEVSPEREGERAESLRTKKATFSVCSRRGGPGELMGEKGRFGEVKLCFVTFL